MRGSGGVTSHHCFMTECAVLRLSVEVSGLEDRNRDHTYFEVDIGFVCSTDRCTLTLMREYEQKQTLLFPKGAGLDNFRHYEEYMRVFSARSH